MRHRQSARRLVGVLAVALLAGCGSSAGSDGSGTASTSRPTRTTTTAPAGETTTGGAASGGPNRPADAKTTALAVAGVLDPRDFGASWTISSKNTGPVVQQAASTGCGITEGSPFPDLALGAIQAGPTMKLNDELHFVGSSAFAFPTAAAAEREIEDVSSKAWATCKLGELQTFQDDNATGKDRFTVALGSRTTPGLGTRGFESYARFEIRDAQGDIVGFTEFSYYRIGRVVIRVQVDTGAIKDKDAFQKNEDAYRAFLAAYDRVAALQTPGRGTTTTAGG